MLCWLLEKSSLPANGAGNLVNRVMTYNALLIVIETVVFKSYQQPKSPFQKRASQNLELKKEMKILKLKYQFCVFPTLFVVSMFFDVYHCIVW